MSTWQDYFCDRKFDSILLLMNGLGLAGSLQKLPDFLLHLSKYLLSGGSIIADSSDINYLFEEEDDGGVSRQVATSTQTDEHLLKVQISVERQQWGLGQ